jgi:hypothetical protein
MHVLQQYLDSSKLTRITEKLTIPALCRYLLYRRWFPTVISTDSSEATVSPLPDNFTASGLVSKEKYFLLLKQSYSGYPQYWYGTIQKNTERKRPKYMNT